MLSFIILNRFQLQTFRFSHLLFEKKILGTSIKRYNHGISCVVRIIQVCTSVPLFSILFDKRIHRGCNLIFQLVKLHDVLASHIAIGIIHMITECGCNGLMKEVMKEIDQTKPTEVDSRNISIFLETIATTQPNIVIPILDDMMDYLSSEVCATALV